MNKDLHASNPGWISVSFLRSVIKYLSAYKYTLPWKAKIGHILGGHTGIYIAAVHVVATSKALKTLPHARLSQLSHAIPWCFSERDGLDVQHLNLVYRANGECVIIHQSKTGIGKNRKE